MGNLVIPGPVEPAAKRTEGSLSRARRDLGEAMESHWFKASLVTAGALATVVTYPFLEDSTHSLEARAFVAGGTLILGAMIALLLVFTFMAARAPYRQRDEARARRDDPEGHSDTKLS